MLSTEAVVFWKRLVVLKVALGALPVEDMLSLLRQLLIDVPYPLFDTLEMHGDAAASTCPYPLFSSDLLRANDAAKIVLTALSLDKPRGINFFISGMTSWMLLGHIFRFVLV